VPATLLRALKARHEQATKDIVVAYPKNSEREERKPQKRGGAGKKKRTF